MPTNSIQPEEILVRVGSLQLAAKQWGDRDKPALLALHGWLDNAASFDRLAPLLAEHRLIALDFAGHGFSDHRPDGVRYHLLDNVDDVLGFADALDLQQFNLLGHSMGAGVATYVASSFPERIMKLILIEGIGTQASPVEDAPAILRKAVEDMQKVSLKRKPQYESVEAAIRVRAQSIGGISEDAARLLCARGLEPAGEGVTWRSDPRLKMSSAMRLTEPMVLAHLAALTMPVLLIRGEQSFFVLNPLLQKRVDAIPHAQAIALPGNHHLHLEGDTVGAVAGAIRDFLMD